MFLQIFTAMIRQSPTEAVGGGCDENIASYSCDVGSQRVTPEPRFRGLVASVVTMQNQAGIPYCMHPKGVLYCAAEL